MQYETKKKQIHTNTNKSTHSDMGPVWQNPIQRTVRTAHLSVLMTVCTFSTQHNTERFWQSPLLPQVADNTVTVATSCHVVWCLYDVIHPSGQYTLEYSLPFPLAQNRNNCSRNARLTVDKVARFYGSQCTYFITCTTGEVKITTHLDHSREVAGISKLQYDDEFVLFNKWC